MKTQKEHKGTKVVLVLAVVLLAMNAFSVSAKNQNSVNILSDTSSQKYIENNTTSNLNYANNANSVLAFHAGVAESASLSEEYGLYYEDLESGIMLEDWMLNSEHNFWTETYEDIEDEIKLEDWMLDASKW